MTVPGVGASLLAQKSRSASGRNTSPIPPPQSMHATIRPRPKSALLRTNLQDGRLVVIGERSFEIDRTYRGQSEAGSIHPDLHFTIDVACRGDELNRAGEILRHVGAGDDLVREFLQLNAVWFVISPVGWVDRIRFSIRPPPAASTRRRASSLYERSIEPASKPGKCPAICRPCGKRNERRRNVGHRRFGARAPVTVWARGHDANDHLCRARPFASRSADTTLACCGPIRTGDELS